MGAVWEAMGITLGEPVASDPLFRHATLPKGWRKQPTDHAMWSKLVDAQGRERASIFYKAAFYDRSAFIRPDTRFHVQKAPTEGEKWDGPMCYVVKDGDQECFRSQPIPSSRDIPPGDREGWDRYQAEERAAEGAAVVWLIGQGFPDWRNPVLYWDAPPVP
jgi:hypothetical protein